MPARRLSTESYLDECGRAGRLATPRTRRENELLRRHLAAGRLSMPYEGFFLRASALEQLDPTTIYLHLIRAVAHLHPHWTFCSFTAAVLYGLQVPRPLLKRLHIAVPPSGSRRRLPGTAVCHPVPDNSHTRQPGINVCPILPTLLSCMCQADFRYGLAIVDSALRWQLVDREELRAYLREHGRGRHGVASARRTTAYADGRSENGGESIVRGIMIDLGFALPGLQVEIEDPLCPGAMKRVDYLWRRGDGKVIIAELDGMGKYQPQKSGGAGSLDHAVSVLAAERRRESRINLTGATVVRSSLAEALDEGYFFRLLSEAGVPMDAMGARS